MASYEGCPNQRNLTDKSREEARAVGEHVKRLKIPVGRVLASPFSRTLEIARLAFGKARPMQEARGGPSRTDDPKRYDGLRKLLASQPSPGTNANTVTGPIAIVLPEVKNRNRAVKSSLTPGEVSCEQSLLLQRCWS
jgi:hypothetical protein